MTAMSGRSVNATRAACRAEAHLSFCPEVRRTWCSSRACSTPHARRRSVSGTAAAGTDSARHAILRAAKKSSGVRAVQSVMSAACFAWSPGDRAGGGAWCRQSLGRTARSAGLGTCGDTDTRRLCRPWKASAARWPASVAQAVPRSGRTALSRHACYQRPRRLRGRGCRRGAFRTVRGRDGALRIGSATRTRKSSSVSRAG